MNLEPLEKEERMALGARSPTQRADLAGAAYAVRVSDSHRKKLGLYLTPVAVATFMAGEIAASVSTVRILDPAAGAGILLCAAVETLVTRTTVPKRIELVAYEIDAALVEVLTGVLGHLKDWARSRGTEVAVKVVPSDFVLEHAGSLSSIGGFLPHLEARQAFDVVIANPPYFKLNKADRRAKVAAAVVHGQPNIYSLFMAIGAALLREGGELIYITPRSFASGPYFRLFREWFFNNVRPASVHVFGSRRQAFSRDEVLQENVIFRGIRRDTWADRKGSALLTISASHGIEDLDSPARRSVQLAVVLDMASREKVLRLPVSPDEDDLLRFVDCWPGSLGAYGMQISTGPVVPFRATEFVDDRGRVPERHVPLLWMNHVKRMQVRWPLGQHKPEYMKHVKAALPLLVPNRNYVLLRRFSAKEETRRLVAGPYLARAYSVSMLGLENHLNYIYRPRGSLSDDEAFGLAALFSSSLLDRYFRTSNGNTQVSATELRVMPLPAHEIIVEIGRQAQSLGSDVDAIDALVMRLVGTEDEKMKARARG